MWPLVLLVLRVIALRERRERGIAFVAQFLNQADLRGVVAVGGHALDGAKEALALGFHCVAVHGFAQRREQFDLLGLGQLRKSLAVMLASLVVQPLETLAHWFLMLLGVAHHVINVLGH